ncbi:MAG TPA: hypothetical protein VE861_08330, partial [Gemmatimonadaceae bacterium]|nr:hypothetical protein [Gemmatimonadaceae bacterium]
MGLRDLLDKGKCLIGLHDGPWTVGQPDDCHFTRRCVRCAAEHHKVEHRWGDWRFTDDGACDQQRSCPRCDEHEVRVTHSFGEPQYVTDASCEQQSTCARCRQSQAAAPRHVMDRWRFTITEACTQVEQCSRCNA